MTRKRPIYMDHHATTPLDPRVLERMMPYLTGHFGNAASRSHMYGWEAEEAVEGARLEVGALIGARDPRTEIVFTSGATEADNLALKGVAHASASPRGHIITQRTEHKAVLASASRLEREGFRVTLLDVDRTGRVDPGAVEAAIEDDTILVSIMLANNEVGTVQPIAEIGAITHARGVLLHTDATQGVGRIPFDVQRMHVDLASLSAHKIHGPKGVGVLYVRRTGGRRVHLVAEVDGGGHERAMRSGTLNVPGIVGMGAAATILKEEGLAEAERVRSLRERLRARLFDKLEEIHMNGADDPDRLPGNLNVSFGYVEGEGLILALQKYVAVSSGAACASATVEPSYVLRAMGLDKELADASIRFGLGRDNTEAEVDEVADRVIREVRRLRKLSPLWKMREQGLDPKELDW